MHTLAGLEFTMRIWLPSNLWESSWLCLIRARITDMCHCALCVQYLSKYLIFKIMCVCVCVAGKAPEEAGKEFWAPWSYRKLPEAWCGFGELNSGLAKEQQVPLAAETSLQTNILKCSSVFTVICLYCYLLHGFWCENFYCGTMSRLKMFQMFKHWVLGFWSRDSQLV